MRRIRFNLAMSLDGYIADPNGGYDWIVEDPDIDFTAIASEYDTLLMGRGTWEVVQSGGGMMPDMRTIVVSRTLRQEDHPDITIVRDHVEDFVRALREEPGKDIWLFGGGQLFRTLLAAGLVDTLEPSVVPVLLGDGIPLLPSPADRARLRLTGTRTYEKSGIVTLLYDVERGA